MAWQVSDIVDAAVKGSPVVADEAVVSSSHG